MPLRFMRILNAASIVLGLALTLGAFAWGGTQDSSTAELPYEGKDSQTSILGRMDLSLILRSWVAKGVLVCTHGFDIKVCLWVENAYPSGVIEVLRQPYKTHLAEMQATLKSLQAAAAADSRSASHTPLAGDGTAKQFAEAHVYTYVPDLGLSNSEIPIAVPTSTAFQTDYLTEQDGFAWRSPLIDQMTCPEARLGQFKSCGWAPDPVTCAGTWGSYYPRIGFISHPSQPIAAAMQALRAGRVANRPIGRTVLAQYAYEPRTGHYLQMIQPMMKLATSIGSPFPDPLEAGAGSKYGNYLFVHFGIFEYCAECLPVRLVEARTPF